jgi:hypothetical protein
MRIIYTDMDDKPYAKELGAERVDMETLLKESEFVPQLLANRLRCYSLRFMGHSVSLPFTHSLTPRLAT